MDTADAPPKPPTRKRMQVFFAKDAVEPPRDMMNTEGVDDSVKAALARLYVPEIKIGAGERTVLAFSEPGGAGMSIMHAWFKSGYVLPRHSHNTDCLYYVTAGELHMGSHVLRKGDGFFVPADHAYGYEAGPEGVEIVEFRGTSQFNFVFKGNDEAYWDKVVDTYRERDDIWETEVPPSDR